MAETVLQTYLNQQFIKISDEGNIALLGKAVTTVYKNLQNKKQKVIPYTLVGINPSISETDPVVLEVEKTIIAKWKGFKNSVAHIKDKPTTYIRAVILAALSKLAKEDGTYAAIIWHSSQDVLKYFKTGSEKQYFEQFLLGQGNKVQKLAEVSWGDKAGQKDKMTQPAVELPNAKSTTVDGEVFSNSFLMAAQHTGWKSHSDNIGDNPHTPNQPNWAKVFSEKAGSGIAREINAAFTKQGKLTNATLAGLDTYFKNMASFFGEISNTVISNAEAVHRRTDLLWWKESLYSKSLNCSYRKADKIVSGLAMAVDLVEMVPGIYPVSVDYFLKETLKDVFGEEVDSLENISSIVETAAKLKDEEKGMLKQYSSKTAGIKLCIEGLANHLLQENEVDFYKEVGIAKTEKVSVSDFVLWIFHNMQAVKIANSK